MFATKAPDGLDLTLAARAENNKAFFTISGPDGLLIEAKNVSIDEPVARQQYKALDMGLWYVTNLGASHLTLAVTEAQRAVISNEVKPPAVSLAVVLEIRSLLSALPARTLKVV